MVACRNKWENECIFITNRYTIIYIPIFVNIVLLLLFDYRCLSFSLCLEWSFSAPKTNNADPIIIRTILVITGRFGTSPSMTSTYPNPTLNSTPRNIQIAAVQRMALWYRLNIVANTNINIKNPINRKVICNIVIFTHPLYCE